MHELMAELYPVCRSITGDGVRQTLAILRRHIPLEIQEVPSGTPAFAGMTRLSPSPGRCSRELCRNATAHTRISQIIDVHETMSGLDPLQRTA